MPEIKCHHGCSMSVGTDQWVSTLTIDQMRYAREAMNWMKKTHGYASFQQNMPHVTPERATQIEYDTD